MTTPTSEISSILCENYYTLVTTGRQALVACWADYHEGFFDENLSEWGISNAELESAIVEFEARIIAEGLLNTEACFHGYAPASRIRTAIRKALRGR